MPVELPDAELSELASILDSGEFRLLRDMSGLPRFVRQDLTRYTDRLWLFPFGGDPDPSQPIDVFLNGLVLRAGHDFQLVQVASRQPITALVFDHPTSTGDAVTSTYTALPEAAR